MSLKLLNTLLGKGMTLIQVQSLTEKYSAKIVNTIDEDLHDGVGITLVSLNMLKWGHFFLNLSIAEWGLF